MSVTLPPPTPEADAGGRSGAGGTAPPEPDDRRPPGQWPGRRPLAVLLTIAVLLGGAITTGALAVTGTLGNDASTTPTVLPSSSSDASAGSTTSIEAKAIYASASDGVVEITATGTGTSQPNPFGGGGGGSQSTATGSGFVIDGQGDIVTAAHVVNGASSLKVTFPDGTTRTATLSGKDNATDVAVLKIDPSGLKLHPLALGSSASLTVGDALAVIGSPFGYENSISTGIVSGLDRTIDAPNGYSVAHALQTDAALNPGNSGGPILDSSGRVVGIADQIATSGSADQSAGVGFAVPIDLVANELKPLEAGQTVKHAYLGVSTTDSPGTTGAVIASVASGGPAAGAGLKAGDIVTGIDGKTIAGPGDVVAVIGGHKPGDQVKVTVRRGSSTVNATVTLGTEPTTQSSSSPG
jgi:putative serine protease PepD